jgi:uncharacterized membrane protein
MAPISRERVQRLRDSFWFLPVTLVVLAIVLAEVAVGLDRAIGSGSWGEGADSFVALGVSGSRGILVAVGGSMLTVAATSFSITISVVATASSTYGPRLVRNFMADRRNQLVLGTFVATFVYSLVVLRSVSGADGQGGGTTFVPHLAVYVAIVIAILNVAALVYFIHHIADSIQVSTLIERVRNDLRRVVKDQYPAEPPENSLHTAPLPTGAPEVTAGRTGYVVSVDEAGLLRLAAQHDGVIEVLPPVGTHVLDTEPVVRTTCDPSAVEAGVRRCVWIDDARTPHQDVSFAVQQLVEVAVRALSPGVNDPYTARNAVSELGAGMTMLARHGIPPLGRTDDDGRVRLVVRRVPVVELVDGVFDDLRVHGAREPYVVRSAVKLAGRIVAACDDDLARRVREHVRLMLAEHASGRPDFDTGRLQAYAAEHLDDGLDRDGAPARG